MLDPAILDALDRALPPQPPMAAIVENWVSPAGTAARGLTQRLTGEYDKLADEWLQKMDKVRADIHAVDFPPSSAAELANLDERIAEFEGHAEMRATQSARSDKRLRREVKTLFKVDPSVGAAAREYADRLLATDRRIVEALLDWALILRAIRAEGSGEARGGPVFDNADDLAKHLDALAA